MELRIFAAAFLIITAFGTNGQASKREVLSQWSQCCEENVCLRNWCYSVEKRLSPWMAHRQRCQSHGHMEGHLLTLREETDLQQLWTQFHDKFTGKQDPAGLPPSLWTGGMVCAQKTNVLTPSWSWNLEDFPAWLMSKIEKLLADQSDLHGACKFLVVYTAPNASEIQYEFQHQNARHAAICEFSLPEEVTTQSYQLATSFIPQTSAHRGTSFISTSTTRPTLTPKTLGTAGWSSTWSSGTQSTNTTPATTVTTTTENVVSPSTEAPGFCVGREAASILWPDTAADSLINVTCPQGMEGHAHWFCNGTTLQFTPEKPHIEDCRHVWIKDLEDDVEDGNDAVAISFKMDKETHNKSMSHGDVAALVNLSVRILRLYAKQKGEEEFEVDEDEKIPLPYTFSKSMVSSMSNILRQEIKTAWENLPEEHQTKVASQILQVVEIIGSRLSCIRKSAEKLQFTVITENIGLQTFILNGTKAKEDTDFLTFPQQTANVTVNSSITLPVDIPLKSTFSSCRNYNSAVGVIYNNVGDFLKDEQGSESKIASRVISFSVSNDTAPLRLPKGQFVDVTLQHLVPLDNQRGLHLQPRCVFWNFSKKSFGGWDSSGCFLVGWNASHTLCKCNHLTNFAVLMDVNNNVKEDEILSLMTAICCSVSSLALILTLICFFAIRSLHGRRSIITGNLCVSLLITNVLILFGLDQTQNKTLCGVIAGMLHFWILSAFCWMLVEGYHLYRMIILVFQRGNQLSIRLYYIFAYGTAIVVVGISAGIRPNDFGGPDYCWLSTNNGLMWSFVGPACLIISINVVIFILALRSASSVKIKREQSAIKKIKSWFRGSMSVLCLLGLTWCLGLFYSDQNLGLFSYIFTVLNGLQGLFIFVFHILLNEKVISWMCKWSQKRKDRRKSLNQTSSNRLHSKTWTRTSTSNSNGCTNLRTASTRVGQPTSPTEINHQPIASVKSKAERSTSGKRKDPTVFYFSCTDKLSARPVEQ